MMKDYLKQTEKSSLAALILLEAASIFTLFFCVKQGNWLFVACTAVQMILLPAPFLLEAYLPVRMEAPLKCIFMGWIFGCIALGTVYNWYYHLSWWDIAMHTTCGLLLTGVGCMFFDLLHPDPESAPWFRLTFGVCFSLATAVLWELWEFAFFYFTGMDMQRDTVLTEMTTAYFTNQDASFDRFSDITEMRLTYGNGETAVVAGYLDIGFFDTLLDMVVHTLGVLTYMVFAFFRKDDWLTAKVTL